MSRLLQDLRAETGLVAVRDTDPGLPVFNPKTMTTLMSDSGASNRLNALLLGVFAAVALALAVIGVYSVMSYTVEQNTREIGIRIAIGAQPRDVVKLVIGQGLLFGVGATDPVTLTAIPLLLGGVAFLACTIPAMRATRVDPLVALRHE
ncbi:MAG: FtsX-like permease family protein [Acidobacteriota bacterium]